MQSITVNGEKYVKASSIARELGYTADYVGQLCRGNKVDAQLVGRSWFVSEQSLKDHKKSRYRSTSAKSREALKKAIETTKAGYDPSMREDAHFYHKADRSTDSNVRYERDEEDLLPSVVGKQTASEKPEMPAERKEEAEEDITWSTAEKDSEEQNLDELADEEDNDDERIPEQAENIEAAVHEQEESEEEAAVSRASETSSEPEPSGTSHRVPLRTQSARITDVPKKTWARRRAEQQQRPPLQPVQDVRPVAPASDSTVATDESRSAASARSGVGVVPAVVGALCLGLLGSTVFIGLADHISADATTAAHSYKFEFSEALEYLK